MSKRPIMVSGNPRLSQAKASSASAVGHHTMPPPTATYTASSVGISLFLVLVAALLLAFGRRRIRSDQTLVTIASLIASTVGIGAAIPQLAPFWRLPLLAALLVAVTFGVLSIRISERKAKQFDQLFEYLTRSSSVEGAAASTQAAQTIDASAESHVVVWPDRQALREQTADLIRNCRAAVKALNSASENIYVETLIHISHDFVGPAVAIRQALRRVLGYPLAAPLDHLPITKSPEEFDTVAEVHEHLLGSIPQDAPAVPLGRE